MTAKPGAAAEARLNLGAGPGTGWMGFFDEGFTPGLVDAACDKEAILRVDDTIEVDVGQGLKMTARDFAGAEERDYHNQDVNLFYINHRLNAAARIAAFTKRKHSGAAR